MQSLIAGHRVRALDIVEWHEHQGITPDQIVSEVPSLTLAEVHAALAYYFDHIDEIREEMRVELVKAKLGQENVESPDRC
jgi:uncharacterized protein (DUF433 family)